MTTSLQWAGSGLASATYLQVSKSDNGQVVLAGGWYDGGGAATGKLWLSTNGGSSWTEQQPAGNNYLKWMACAVSGDGNVLLAAQQTSGGAAGKAWHSTDRGSSWHEELPAGAVTVSWSDVALDSDGSVMVAGGGPGRLYVTVNSGGTWAEKQPAGAVNTQWFVKCDADGSVIVAAASGGRAYVSVNSGTSWGEVTPTGANNRVWRKPAVSSDGATILLYGDGFGIYRSVNTGANWAGSYYPPGKSGASFYTVAVSHDAQTVMVAEAFGRVWVSYDAMATWAETRPSGVNYDYYWRGLDVDSTGATAIVGADYSLYAAYRTLQVVGTDADGGISLAGSASLLTANYILLEADGTISLEDTYADLCQWEPMVAVGGVSIGGEAWLTSVVHGDDTLAAIGTIELRGRVVRLSTGETLPPTDDDGWTLP